MATLHITRAIRLTTFAQIGLRRLRIARYRCTKLFRFLLMTNITYKKLTRKFPAKKLKIFYNESLPGKTLSQCQNIIDHSSVIIGAYDKNRLVGIGRSLDDKVYAFITDIIVNPGYRGQGIGSEIVKVLCDQLVKRKIKVIHCSTEKKLVPFYQKKVKFEYDKDDITLFLKNF